MQGGPFVVYSLGLVHASACTSLSDEEATIKMNQAYPTGLEQGWKIHDGPFATGEANGVACSTTPDTHRHILFSC